MTIATLISNNAYDALVITDAGGSRMHMIDCAETFCDALAVGDAQDLDNWTGDLLDEGVTADSQGMVLAINDGKTLNVVDADLLARRKAFWGQ